MQKYLLDTNIFDEILEDAEAKQTLENLVGNGLVELLITWIVAEEIDKMSMLEKKKAIQVLYSELKITKVPVAGMVIDRSKLDQTILIPFEEVARLEHAISTSENDDNDMAIAMTAKSHNAFLVTNDKVLLNKAQRLIQVRTCNWIQFLNSIKQI